jgi:sec-independent protein translocase protein TatA
MSSLLELFKMPLPSGFEWIVILVIALLILGPGKLPDVASAVGKSIREFRKASSDVQEAVKVDTSPLPAPTPTPNVLTQAPVVPPPSAAEVPAAPPAAPQPVTSDQTTESH